MKDRKAKLLVLNQILLMTLMSVFFIGCNKSYATREIYKPVDEMARQSELIVLAKCINNKTLEESNGLLYTITTFNVEDVVSGELSEKSISIKLPGGTTSDRDVNVPDRPEFVDNEEVVLFLGNKTQEGYYTLESLNEGVYRIQYDQASDTRFVSSGVDGMTVYNSTTGKESGSANKVSLEDFIFSLKKLTGK